MTRRSTSSFGTVPLGVAGIITPGMPPSVCARAARVGALHGQYGVLKPLAVHAARDAEARRAARDVLPPAWSTSSPAATQLGAWMTEHPRIDKISFTGSVATGKKVLASAAATLKRVTLELGGNDPAIVLDDVDPKAIAPKIFFAGVREQRPGLHGDQAHLCAREDLRRRSATRSPPRRRSAEGRRRPRPRDRARADPEQDAVRQGARVIEDTKKSAGEVPRGRRQPKGRAIF